MRYFKAISLGIVGILVGQLLFWIVLYYTSAIYGFYSSVIGWIAAAHVVAGFSLKNISTEKEQKNVTIIAIVVATIASILPYVFFTYFEGFIDLIFIAIGIYGGYELPRYLFNRVEEDSYSAVPVSAERISLSSRLKIIIKKGGSLIVWYAITTLLIIALGNTLLPDLGVSWVFLAIFFVYDLWRRKIFTVTDEDV